jgi:hypothetical protein
MSSVKVSFVVFLDDKSDKKIDKKINKLLDKLGAVDTTNLKLSWDNCDWEIIEKGEN